MDWDKNTSTFISLSLTSLFHFFAKTSKNRRMISSTHSGTRVYSQRIEASWAFFLDFETFGNGFVIVSRDKIQRRLLKFFGYHLATEEPIIRTHTTDVIHKMEVLPPLMEVEKTSIRSHWRLKNNNSHFAQKVSNLQKWLISLGLQ